MYIKKKSVKTGVRDTKNNDQELWWKKESEIKVFQGGFQFPGCPLEHSIF